MPSTYSPNLRIELIASGEQGNTWGNTTNNNLGSLIESAISGYVELDNWVSNSCTLTALNGAADEARNMYLIVPSTITLSGPGEIIAPSVSKVYVISNYDNGGQDVQIKTASSVGTTIIPNGTTKVVVCDGVEFVDAVSAADSLLLGGDPIDNLQAATKQYVDVGLAAKLNINGSVQMTGALLLYNTLPSASGLCAVPRAYLDSNFLQFTTASSQTMSGPLILSGAPSSSLQAATKGYVDSSIWTVPVAAATYTNSNVTVDSNGRITNITNGTGGGGGTLSSVAIATAYGFTQKGSSGSTNLTLQIGLDATATGGVLYGATGGTIRVATAGEIVSGIGATAVTNATNATNASQLNSQSASYYANSDPVWLTNLSVSKLNAAASAGYVLTTNGSAAYWAPVSGGGGGTVTSVSGTNTNGFTISISNPTSTPNIVIGTSLSTLLAGNGSGLTQASQANVISALGYTPVSTSGSGATGTWGISISGTASSASSASTAGSTSTVTAGGSVTTGNVAVAAGGNVNVAGMTAPALSSGNWVTAPNAAFAQNCVIGGLNQTPGGIGNYVTLSYDGGFTFGASPSESGRIVTSSNIINYYAKGVANPANTAIGIAFGTGGNIGAFPDGGFSMGSATNRFSAIYAVNGTIQTSDGREKTSIKESDLGLSFIESLTPRSYKWIKRLDPADEATGEANPAPGVRTHYGLIAQEVETALAGKDFAGFVYDEEADSYGLRYDQFIAPLIKAVQELNAQVTALTAEVNTLKGA